MNDLASVKLDLWRNRLLDRTRKNRLLYFKPTKQSIQITAPPLTELYRRLVVEERPLDFSLVMDERDLVLSDEAVAVPAAGQPFPPAARPAAPRAAAPAPPGGLQTLLSPRELARILYKVRLQSQSTIAEQGVNTLYLALGMLEWREAETASETVRAPLLLVPVMIEQRDEDRSFRLRLSEDDVVLNPTLVYKLRGDFDIVLPEVPDDETDAWLLPWLGQVRQAVRRQKWTVAEEAWLGQFSFLKLAMYRDLEAYRAEVAEHPVVAALARVKPLPAPAGSVPDAEELDRAHHSAAYFPVLDADSSQIEAIAGAHAGHHLIIDGPPGTGKSQTITNLIVDLLAEGKKVLFVSEKMAALEVVHDRLRDAGFGPFCLEAHSHRGNKRDVIGRLGDSLLGNDPLPRAYETEAQFAELWQRRDHLNAYARALHRPLDPRQRTAFQVHGELAHLRGLPDVPFELPISGILRLPPAEDERMQATVRRIAVKPELLRGYRNHPWRDSTIITYSLALQQQLEAQFTSLTNLAGEIYALLPSLSSRCGLETPATIERAEWLFDTARLVVESPLPPSEWFVRSSLQPLLESARSYKERFDHWHAERDDLLRCYTPKLFDLTCAHLAERLGPAHAGTLTRINRNRVAAATAAIFHRAALAHNLDAAQGLLTRLPDELAALAVSCGLPIPATLAEAEQVCQTGLLVGSDPRPLPEWLRWDALAGLQADAEEAQRRQAARREARATLDAVFKLGIYDLPAAEWLARFTEDYGGIFRGLKGGYKRDRAALEGLLREPARLSHAGAVAHLKHLVEYQEMEASARERHAALAVSFGMHEEGEGTDWDAVLRAIDIVRRLLALHGGLLPDTVKRTLLQSGPALRAVRGRADTVTSALAEIRECLARLEAVVSLSGIVPGSPVLEDAPLDQLTAVLAALADDLRSVWGAYDEIARNLQPGVGRTSADVIEDAARAAEVQGLQAEVMAHRSQLTESYGSFFAGMDTAWDEVIDALGWTGDVKARFGDTQPPFAFIRAVTQGSDVPAIIREDHQRLGVLLARMPAERAGLHAIFSADTLLIDGQPFGRVDLGALVSWLDTRRRGVGLVQEWVDFLNLRAECEAQGLSGFLTAVLERGVAAEHVESVFRRRFLTRWLDEAYNAVPELGRFRREEHEYVAQRFRDLDRALRQATAGRIARSLAQRRPHLAAGASPVEASEMGILLRETRKKVRHMPLRRLFAQIPHLLLDLKPCLLMSPLSVAHYLPKDSFAFDVVIFDEASQISPEDAIGAMLRARQVIVAGDDKQLPPTAFFTAEDAVAEDDEDAALAGLESILDECAALPAMRRSSLRWHYRSRHESLIAFSNAAFYRNNLITFPGPDADRNEAGVRFEYVGDGVWDRGRSRTNVGEARRVADLAFEHFEHWGGQRSLGVITLNQAQADCIHDELRTRRRERRDFEEFFAEEGQEPFFIKSLENVQGDERDAIILCIGYGPDANGVVALNFGPINREGGERRLNVAVTRAKWQLTLVSSMQPEQMELARLNRPNRGVEVLQQCLHYARDGRVPVESAPLEHEPDSPFEEAVRDALRASGLAVDTQVGCSGFRIDLAVRHPDHSGRYILGVECDGTTYHASRTARDRDRLRQEVLEKLGWSIHRIWSTDWVRDPASETARVIEVIEGLRATTPAPAEQPRTQEGEDAVLAELEELETGPATTADHTNSGITEGGIYSPFEIRAPRPQEDLYTSRPNRLAQDVMRVVAAEGPIHETVLAQRVARMYGIARTGSTVRDLIGAGIVEAVRRGTVRRRGDFFWPAEMTAPIPRRLALGDAARPIEHIAPEEILAAAELIIARNYHMPRATLVDETAHWLGFQRMGAKVLAAIDAAVAPLYDRGARAG